MSAPIADPDGPCFHIDDIELGSSRNASIGRGESDRLLGSKSGPAYSLNPLATTAAAATAGTGPTIDDCMTQEYLNTPLLASSRSNESAQHLFGTPPPQLYLEWNNIDLFVPSPTPTDPHAKRKILSNVSGRAWPGETVAIMGPSGSGKTSLLSQLAGGWRKSRANGNLSGEIIVNGQPISKKVQRYLAYIEQDDVLFANLTVEQSLRFSALLNLPRDLSRQEKLDRVEQTIQLLGLTKCRSTKIGGGFSRGVSGGERKRTSAATEMLSNPSIITADEPTSGLDSTTAARLIHTFRSLARGGRTVLCSIHQPSSIVFNLFDKVICLAQGRMVYYGAPSQVSQYFASTGLMCKPHFNLADFMLDLVSDLTTDAIEKEEKARKDAANGGGVVDAQKAIMPPTNGETSTEPIPSPSKPTVSLTSEDAPESSFDVTNSNESAETAIRRLPFIFGDIGPSIFSMEDSLRKKQLTEGNALLSTILPDHTAGVPDGTTTDVESQTERWPLTWFEQFQLLLSRAFIQHRGEKDTLFIIQMVAICIISSFIWFRTSDDVEYLTERTGSIFFLTMHFSFTPLFNSLSAFPAERGVILRERGRSSYRLSAYFVAKMCAEAPLELIVPILHISVWYWVVGLQPFAANFFYYILTILLSTLTAQAYGLAISCTLNNFKESIAFASVSMLALMLLSGFYVKLQNIPVWLRWISYLCFPKYTYSILAYIQFEGYEFQCGDQTTFTHCPVAGREIMSLYDFDTLPVGANIGILIGIAIVFRMYAYAALRKTTQP